jgi:hypothetical protein
MPYVVSTTLFFTSDRRVVPENLGRATLRRLETFVLVVVRTAFR